MNRLSKLTAWIFMRRNISPTRIIVLGFTAIILVGAVLLSLPVASKSREFTNFLHCIFTATSASCVTGLAIYDTASHWSFFGQFVILLLIQTGGLGFMTIMAIFMFAARFRIGIKSKLMIMQNFSLESMQGIVVFIKHVISFTIAAEVAGALLLSFKYVPRFGIHGIWLSIFHSVSAFCNAGFDLNGIIEPGISMRCFYNSPIVLITLSALIIVGGIGFFVWEMLIWRSRREMSVYTKIVIITTVILLVSGTVFFGVAEWHNPDTIGGFTVPQKILNSFFESATLRTAGFESIAHAKLTQTGKILCVLYMVIGGSAGSTAGGVKTATVFVITASVICALMGKRDTIVFKRRISHTRIISAFTIVVMALVFNVIGAIFVSCADNMDFIDCLFETVSAYATVGLSVGVTAEASNITLILYILYMFIGRVGVTTIGIGILTGAGSGQRSEPKYPRADIMIG